MLERSLKMTKIVGVKIATKSKSTKDKVYYYKTNKNFEKGETIRVRVPSGGTPKSTVVTPNSRTKRKNIKNLIVSE